jgi:hypothetical protein
MQTLNEYISFLQQFVSSDPKLGELPVGFYNGPKAFDQLQVDAMYVNTHGTEVCIDLVELIEDDLEEGDFKALEGDFIPKGDFLDAEIADDPFNDDINLVNILLGTSKPFLLGLPKPIQGEADSHYVNQEGC